MHDAVTRHLMRPLMLKSRLWRKAASYCPSPTDSGTDWPRTFSLKAYWDEKWEKETLMGWSSIKTRNSVFFVCLFVYFSLFLYLSCSLLVKNDFRWVIRWSWGWFMDCLFLLKAWLYKEWWKVQIEAWGGKLKEKTEHWPKWWNQKQHDPNNKGRINNLSLKEKNINK